MKPWLKNVLIIIGVLILAAVLPVSIKKNVLSLIVFGSAIWVYTDAKKLEIQKYKKTALTLSTTPFGAAGIVAILWIIAFPMYISWRQRAIDGKLQLKEVTN